MIFVAYLVVCLQFSGLSTTGNPVFSVLLSSAYRYQTL